MSQLDDIRLKEIAIQMLKDYDTHTPGTAFAAGLRLHLEEAWLVQNIVATLREKRGETVVGYKIGCVSDCNQQSLGLTHPVWGRLWSTEQYNDGVELCKADFANLAIEAEFAITINKDICADKASAETVAEAVESVFPVLELHNLVLHSGASKGHELIANNAIHAGVVRGAGVTCPEGVLETDLALLFDEQSMDSWNNIRWPTDVLSAIQWLALRLKGDGKQLVKGDTILTSAMGPPLPVGEARQVNVTSSAFGNVRATFV